MTHSATSIPRIDKADTIRTIWRLTELFPVQDATGTRIAIAIYKLLARQDRATISEIAIEADAFTDDVAAQLDTWPAVYRDEGGAVIGFWGLTAHPMSHRFTVGGRDRFTWCAWDALFIPELIGETVEVISTTPVDSRNIRLRVSPQSVTPLDPNTPPLHVSFHIPEADEWEADVIATFCHHVFFLCEDEVERWLADNPGSVTLALDDAFQAGKLKNAHQFPQ